MASENNGNVICPKTKETFPYKKVEKVFVMWFSSGTHVYKTGMNHTEVDQHKELAAVWSLASKTIVYTVGLLGGAFNQKYGVLFKCWKLLFIFIFIFCNYFSNVWNPYYCNNRFNIIVKDFCVIWCVFVVLFQGRTRVFSQCAK